VTVPFLTPVEAEQFRTKGYVVVPDAVTPAELVALRADLAAWIDESRGSSQNYG